MYRNCTFQKNPKKLRIHDTHPQGIQLCLSNREYKGKTQSVWHSESHVQDCLPRRILFVEQVLTSQSKFHSLRQPDW